MSLLFHPFSTQVSNIQTCHVTSSSQPNASVIWTKKVFFSFCLSISLFLSLCEFSLNPSPCLFSLSLSLSFPLSLSLLGSLSLFLSTVVYSMRPLFWCTHRQEVIFQIVSYWPGKCVFSIVNPKFCNFLNVEISLVEIHLSLPKSCLVVWLIHNKPKLFHPNLLLLL